MSSRLILGTAQFGMPYGIANRSGQVAPGEATAVLAIARQSGIDTLDTAVAYRDSEARLGAAGIDGWRVVTKLPPLPADCADAAAWVDAMVMGSLGRLGVSSLYGLLLHRSRDLGGPAGEALYAAMSALKAAGRVQKIGVSIYDPAEIEVLSGRFALDLLQTPFNVVDRRIRDGGWLARLQRMGTEVHARSVFLQGLLLMAAGDRPARFAAWGRLWTVWEEWVSAQQVTPLQACLAFALAQPEIAGVVVGVDSSRQLREILAADALRSSSILPAELACDDPDLINPSRWSLS